MAAAPAEAGLGKGKDRAARRRESAGSGGTAQTLVSAVVTWHAAKGCCCRAALKRSDEEHLDGEGGVKCPHALHALHVLTLDVKVTKLCVQTVSPKNPLLQIEEKEAGEEVRGHLSQYHKGTRDFRTGFGFACELLALLFLLV